MPSNRVEFSAKVRRLIAARAGYLCSKPDCRRPTLGPGPGPQDTACIGVAAHIYSAAPGGPRGTGGWLPDRRAAVANGIWLCQDHAWLIDTNNGDAFPAKLLFQWRSLHQAFLQLEMRGINPAPIGLVTEIAVSGGPGDLASRTLSLSMLNLVQGANDTGKSMLLDLLASPDAPHYLSDRRWMNGLSADIRWFDPNPRTLRLEAPAGQMRFVSEDRSTPVVSAPYRAVVVRGGQASLRSHHDLASELGLSEHVFLQVLAQVPERVQGIVTEVDLRDPVPIVRFDGSPEPLRCDETASFGQMWTVLLESAIALAQIRSDRESTLLLIDEPEMHLHSQTVHRLFRLLGERTSGFQTLVVSHAALPADVRRGWCEIELEQPEIRCRLRCAPSP